MSSRWSSLARNTALLSGYALLSIGMTWPLATKLASHVVRTKWHYDSMVNMMILGSRMHYALGIGTLESIYDNYFCAPVPMSIANNENLFGMTLLYAPFFVATRDPLLSYNLLLLTCLTLSGFFACLLVRRLTNSTLAGALVGVAFAHCPYVFFEMGRVQLVAMQWIPLCALFLHDAIETKRRRSVIGLTFAYLMQIGSCLYYAMFVAIYVVCIGGWLWWRHREGSMRLLRRLAAAGVVALVPAAFMAYPYVVSRKEFPLTRSVLLAQEYAGRFAHLAQVYPQNKSLAFLHDEARGGSEPIAFPGFVLVGLALAAIGAPIVRAYRRAAPGAERRSILTGVVLAPLTLFATFGAGILLGDFLWALVPFVAGSLLWRAWRTAPLLPPIVHAYGAFLVLVLALFLGPLPFAVDDEPVRGLYYYLYEHVPGFDGIRYVSRFAVLIMLGLTVLGGLGAAALFEAMRSARQRALAFAILLVLILFELRNAPVSLAWVPGPGRLTPAVQWLANRPGPEPAAIMPAYPKGHHGARNDYLALFLQRRTINGKSSWMPPITHLYINETQRFPHESMTRMLRTFGVKYLLLHADEYDPPQATQALRWLADRPDSYRLVFDAAPHFVYEVLPGKHEGVGLLPTPALPAGAVPLRGRDLKVHASRNEVDVRFAVDGDPKTAWMTRRNQQAGDWLELGLRAEREVVAIELGEFAEAFDAPGAFRVVSIAPDGTHETVFSRPLLRIFRDQVYRPDSFVFRVVFPEPVRSRLLRVELLDGVAGRWWSVHEATVWVRR